MLDALRDTTRFSGSNNLKTWIIGALVLAVAALAGWKASSLLLAALISAMALLVVLERPAAGIVLMVPAVMLVPFEVLVSSYVRANVALLIVPVLTGIWLLAMVRKQRLEIISSPANGPVLFFIVVASVSLLLSRATWSAFVATPSSFLWIQLGQWSIYIFSMLAFLLSANLLDLKSLRWVTYAYVAIGGIIAVLWALPPLKSLAEQITPPGLANSVYWIWLTAFAGGILLFGGRTPLWFRLFCCVSLVALWSISLTGLREWLSGQIPPAITLIVLLVLRLKRKSVFLLIIITAQG